VWTRWHSSCLIFSCCNMRWTALYKLCISNRKQMDNATHTSKNTNHKLVFAKYPGCDFHYSEYIHYTTGYCCQKM
jgi:hypothetical protein